MHLLDAELGHARAVFFNPLLPGAFVGRQIRG